MELIVLADRAIHKQSHTSVRLAIAVLICCPMLLLGVGNCKHKLGQQKGISIHLKSTLTLQTCSTAYCTGANGKWLMVRAGASAHWKPSVNAQKMPYLLE